MSAVEWCRRMRMRCILTDDREEEANYLRLLNLWERKTGGDNDAIVRQAADERAAAVGPVDEDDCESCKI